MYQVCALTLLSRLKRSRANVDMATRLLQTPA
jgi:hypothetical protein